MSWSTCSSCGASFRNDEALTECPRCQRPLDRPTEPEPAKAPESGEPTAPPPAEAPATVTPDVLVRQPKHPLIVPSVPIVFLVSMACCAVVLGAGAAAVAWDGGNLVALLGPDRDWKTWVGRGAVVGVLLGALVGLLICLASPRREPGSLPVADRLTPHALGAFLTQMGYTFNRVDSAEARYIYHLTLPRTGGTFYVSVVLSPNRANLWLCAYLPCVPLPASNLGEHLLKLLEASSDASPAFFDCVGSNKQLRLSLRLENRDLTPQLFRESLEHLLAWLARTSALWDTKWWLEKTTPGTIPSWKTAPSSPESSSSSHVKEPDQSFKRE